MRVWQVTADVDFTAAYGARVLSFVGGQLIEGEIASYLAAAGAPVTPVGADGADAEPAPAEPPNPESADAERASPKPAADKVVRRRRSVHRDSDGVRDGG